MVTLEPGHVTYLRQQILGMALGGRLDRMGANGWRRAALGTVADCVLGKMLDRSKHTRGTPRPYLRNINVRWGAFDLSDLLTMNFEDRELERFGVLPGDVLVCEGGEPGRAAIWADDQPMLIQKALHRVRPSSEVVPEWIVLNLRYDTWCRRLEQYFTGATIKHFTGRALAAYEIPLPPVAVQRRIVQRRIASRVNQLMVLCDRLEAELKTARDQAALMTNAVVRDMVK